jgi:2-dehydro-3-deoxyphosphogluconate aldolase / (4S)-4-hydroxy-2-oxoglutarate aldolase
VRSTTPPGRLEITQAILDAGLLPLVSAADPELAAEVVLACERGGTAAVEFTNRGSGAWPVFVRLGEILRERGSEAILGIGTVTDAATAALYLASGARFVVAPTFDPEVARLCNRQKVAYIPGCATATEIGRAEESGAEIVKLFPADAAGGTAFIRALLGPSPWSRIMPTGGVSPTRENVDAWIGAGAAALGMGSQLISPTVLAGRRFDELTGTVRSTLSFIAEARSRR